MFEEKNWVEVPVDLRNGQTFVVEFLAEPEIGLLFEPVNGPEHNFRVAQLLRLLKRKRPKRMIATTMKTDSSPFIPSKAFADMELFFLEYEEKKEVVLEAETEEVEDPSLCRRAWLSDLHVIEEKLAEDLQRQLMQTEAKEYR